MSTLAEQVVEQLKTDMDNVYDAGYQKGKSEGGGVEDLFQYATNLNYFFVQAEFPQGYELVLNVPNFKDEMNRVLRQTTGIKSVKFKGNNGNNAMQMQYVFMLSSLETVDFTEWGNGEIKGTYVNSMCDNAKYLHTILGVFDCSTFVNVNNVFAQATALKEIRFKENTLSKGLSFAWSKLLSDESIQSIIDSLVDLTGQDAQTITFHADVKAKLTEEQIATITSKNWTLA